MRNGGLNDHGHGRRVAYVGQRLDWQTLRCNAAEGTNRAL